jgi:hypothetical protein
VNGQTKASRVHGTIERTTRMLSVRSAAKCALSFACCSPALPFSLLWVNAPNAFYGYRTLPEPVSRLTFRSSVTTFCAIPESMLLALHLRFPTEKPREFVRSWATPLRPVSRPIRGDLNAQHPFPAPISGALVIPACLRSPLGPFAPSGSKRSACFHHVKLISQNSDLRLLPVAISFDFAPDQHSRSAAFRLINRSVNPGTESIMHPATPTRQMKNRQFSRLSTAFSNITFL